MNASMVGYAAMTGWRATIILTARQDDCRAPHSPPWSPAAHSRLTLARRYPTFVVLYGRTSTANPVFGWKLRRNGRALCLLLTLAQISLRRRVATLGLPARLEIHFAGHDLKATVAAYKERINRLTAALVDQAQRRLRRGSATCPPNHHRDRDAVEVQPFFGQAVLVTRRPVLISTLAQNTVTH